MFLIGFRYGCYYLMFFVNMMFYCIDVIMQLYYQFSDLPPVHSCYGAGHYDSCFTDVTVQNNYLFTFSSVICPLCTDVVVLGLMILVAHMLQCRIIIGLFSVLGWIVITHPIGVAGYISQYFCLMWDCSLWCIWPPLMLLPYCDLLCLLF